MNFYKFYLKNVFVAISFREFLITGCELLIRFQNWTIEKNHPLKRIPSKYPIITNFFYWIFLERTTRFVLFFWTRCMWTKTIFFFRSSWKWPPFQNILCRKFPKWPETPFRVVVSACGVGRAVKYCTRILIFWNWWRRRLNTFISGERCTEKTLPNFYPFWKYFRNLDFSTDTSLFLLTFFIILYALIGTRKGW